MGRVDGYDGLLLACGHSGHGIQQVIRTIRPRVRSIRTGAGAITAALETYSGLLRSTQSAHSTQTYSQSTIVDPQSAVCFR